MAIVWLGVWGEYKAEKLKSPLNPTGFNPTNFSALEHPKKKKYEAIAWGILLGGLAAEAVTSVFVLVTNMAFASLPMIFDQIGIKSGWQQNSAPSGNAHFEIYIRQKPQ
jgi:hypothetical protein